METMVKLWSRYSSTFLQGLGGTLWLAAVTVAGGTLLGLLVALLRMNRIKGLRAAASVYVEILRGTPILLQLYFFWLVLPKILAIEMSDTACIVVALIVNSSSYVCEIVRAGIDAVDKGQWEAARSLGLSRIHMMRRVILPQAVRNILPALVNEFIVMIKETSLASVFFVGELMTSYRTVSASTFIQIPTLTIVGLIYLVVNFTLSQAAKFFERRLKASD
ncbi:MAG: amino acid ABC transporter permease [Oscillibacter sp.]|nr:amino acid ABC transporter permease [Oscillibacter sp.]